MKAAISKIVKDLKRYYLKRKIGKLVLQLPGDLQSSVMHDLLDEVIDLPDRRTKVGRIQEIFKRAKQQLRDPHEQSIADCRQEYMGLMEQAAANVMAPDFPMAHIVINHKILEQKARAKLSLERLEEEIMSIPQVKKFHLFAAGMGICLSTVANYMTVSAKFGNDWIGGNEILTGICNLFFSLLVNLFEAIGLYIFIHFLPERYGKGFARLLGLIGAFLVVCGITIMIFSRTEIGSSIMTGAQMGGKVE